MYKYIEDYKLNEYDELCKRILARKVFKKEDDSSKISSDELKPITYNGLAAKYENDEFYKQTAISLSNINRVRLMLVVSAIEILSRLKEYIKDIEAKKGLEEELGNYKEAIEQTFITLDAICNFKIVENEKNFLENENVIKSIEALKIITFEIKKLINTSEKLKNDFNKILVKKYKKEENMSPKTIAYLFQNRIIDEKETRAILDEKVKNEIIYLYFANLIITNNQLCEIFQNGTQKIIDLLYDGKIDKELFKKLIGLSPSQIFKLNQEDIITDEILFEILSSQDMLEMHKKNGSIKFLTKIPKKDLIKFFFEDKINIEDLIKSNLDICEAFKSEIEKITKEEFIQFYEKIKRDEKIKEEIKKQVLPEEKDIIELYKETILIDGQDILKLYNIQAITLEELLSVYQIQDKEEENSITLENIEQILTAEMLYTLYKTGKLSDNIKSFYILNIKQDIKEQISDKISTKIKEDKDCSTCGMDLFKSGILLLKDLQEKDIVNESDWINSYVNKLEKNRNDRQDIVNEIIESYEQDLISAEAISIIIEEYGLKSEILKICDEGKFSKEKFIQISGIYYTKEDFIKAYEKEEFKTKIPIIMVFNSNFLPMEDFKELYHEGIILEDEIFELAKNEFLSEDKIIELYTNFMLSEDKLNQLEQSGIISKEIFEEAIKNLKMTDIIKELGEIFEINNESSDAISNNISADDIPAIDIPFYKIYGTNDPKPTTGGTSKKPKEVIDPFVREDFIINACRAERIPWRKININEQSSFINYEFYHLLNQNSLITPNDIIIAERYYEDKEIEDSKFAYGNATYLFKMKDLVRIFNKSKSEITNIMEDEKNSDKSAVRAIHGQGWARILLNKILEMQGVSKKESKYTNQEIKYIEFCIDMIKSGQRNIYVDGDR